jgi:hypothetical protein
MKVAHEYRAHCAGQHDLQELAPVQLAATTPGTTALPPHLLSPSWKMMWMQLDSFFRRIKPGLLLAI